MLCSIIRVETVDCDSDVKVEAGIGRCSIIRVETVDFDSDDKVEAGIGALFI